MVSKRGELNGLLAEVLEKTGDKGYKVKIVEPGMPETELELDESELKEPEPKTPTLPPQVVEEHKEMRDDIESHEEVWKELFIKTYSEEELQKMATLITSYNEAELRKLNLIENLYVVVVDEDFDRSLMFKIIPENDDRVIEGRYYTPINLVGYNIDAGLEIDNVYKLFSYQGEQPIPYSPTYLPGDDTPYANPLSPDDDDDNTK